MGIIAERITKARKELGLNQKELAKKASLTEANLSRYENGLREPKSALVLARLADALEVSTDYLVGLTDEKTYDSYDVSKKEEDDILLALKDLESRLKSKDSITFCGQPASDEAIDGILHSIKAGISLAISDIKRK